MLIMKINKPELAAMLKVHRQFVQHLEVIEKKQSCEGCENFLHMTKTCEKWGVVPPPEVQAIGCDDWEYDSIPFNERQPAAAAPAPVTPRTPVPARPSIRPVKYAPVNYDSFDDDIPF